MQFFPVLLIAALASGVYAKCQVGSTGSDENCCWGGKSGSDACLRHNGSNGCLAGTQDSNFCVNMGIPSSKCNVDCCDTRTGIGKPCPKGKKRCDPDTGCGF